VIISEGTAPNMGAALRRWVPVARRRLGIFLLPVVLFTVLGYVAYRHIPARYDAQAVLALDARQFQGLPSESVISPLPQESPVLRTELDIIQSRMMAQRVVDRLKEEGFPLERDVPKGNLLSQLKDLIRGFSKPAGSEVPSGQTDAAAVPTSTLVDDVLGNLNVTNDSRSYTIFISYSAGDPERAARVANAFAQAYIDYQIDIQISATTTVSRWLGSKVKSLRGELENAEKARQDFIQKSNVATFDGMTLAAQRVASLNKDLAGVHAETATAEARLDTARDLARKPGGLVLPEVLGSATIQTLRIEQARVQRRMAEIEDGGANESSELPLLRSQLTTLETQIRTETERVLEGLRNEIAIDRKREEVLKEALAIAQASMDKTGNALVQLAEFDREVSANRAIYESYLARYKQTLEQDGIANPEARVISQAQAPEWPASPRLVIWLLLGIVVGGAVGLAAAALRELTDRRIRSEADLAEATGLPVMGTVSGIPWTGGSRVGDIARNFAFLRSIAAVQAILRSSLGTRGLRTIAVTSARDREGKTTFAASLARSMASSGATVLVIDADLDDPALAEQFGVTPTGFLDEALQAVGPSREVIQSSLVSGIDIIPARRSTILPEILFDTGRFATMLNSLRTRYDVILIDTPAVMLSPVALQVTAQVDGTMMVVNKTKTPITAVTAAIQLLESSGKAPSGLVMTAFSPRRRRRPLEGGGKPVNPKQQDTTGAASLDPATALRA